LIHVKAAQSVHPGRGVSAAAYEVVSGQATKNLIYLDPEELVSRLKLALTYQPACWSHGVRVADRSEIIEAIQLRGASDPLQVTVLQPHLLRSRYHAAQSWPASNPHRPRLHLLETLMNSARASATGVGADLVVLADQQ
jgi:hypothetical protein